VELVVVLLVLLLVLLVVVLLVLMVLLVLVSFFADELDVVLVPNVIPPAEPIVMPGKPGIVTVMTMPPGPVIRVIVSLPSSTVCVGSPRTCGKQSTSEASNAPIDNNK
jgi:hypothetical protein